MPNNFLEQLVAEWYEYQGFLVKRNVRVGRRSMGGHEGELNVVGFHPCAGRLVHAEASMDAERWDERERRFTKKFEACRKYAPQLFGQLATKLPLEQVAVLGYGGRSVRTQLGGGRLVFVRDLLAEIFRALTPMRIASSAMPEHFPILARVPTRLRASRISRRRVGADRVRRACVMALVPFDAADFRAIRAARSGRPVPSLVPRIDQLRSELGRYPEFDLRFFSEQAGAGMGCAVRDASFSAARVGMKCAASDRRCAPIAQESR